MADKPTGGASPLHRLQQAVLAVGMDHPHVDEFPEFDETTAADLIAWAQDERVIGLLWQAAQEGLKLSRSSQSILERSWREATAATLLVESELPALCSALGDSGIEWRALKGVASARQIYTQPGLRIFGDLDILVRPADLAPTMAALAPMTATAAAPLHGPTRMRRYHERQISTPNGVEIDVHHAIDGSLAASRLPIEAFFAEPQSLRIGHHIVHTPSPAASLVHAALHFSSANRRLSSVADLARLARLVEPGDAQITALLRGRTARALFTWAMDNAHPWVDLPEQWLEYTARNRPGRPMRMALDRVQKSPPLIGVVNTFTGDDRVRRWAETMWPTQEFLEHEAITRRQYVNSQLRKFAPW